MINFEIDTYKKADQDDLENFFNEVWSAGKFSFRPQDQHSDLRDIQNIYQSQRGQFWIMRVEGSIIGTIAIKNLGESIAEVKRLNVHPDFQGEGLGSVLFQWALEYATKAEFESVRLDTIRNPGPAMHLYAKHGFVEIPRYNENPHADIFMELTLR